MNVRAPKSQTQVLSPPVSNVTVQWVKRPRTPSPELQKLRRLAKKNRPPQRWYDETINPFLPEK